MIPNIFISSTIADLHYLRDALREAVIDLAYNPIMSEYGDVGYINPTSAAESCYRTVRQCQLAVLIIGRRYGVLAKDGYSVTHREFLTAKEHRIPTIAFVESDVLNYKKLYNIDPVAALWKNVPGMDDPEKTFAFVDDVQNSEFYNGLLPITAAGEAKQLLKRQIADFVGERLSETVRPVRTEVQEVLAELRTLRKEISPTDQRGSEADKYLRATRFLLDEKRADFRKFCETATDDIDTAVTSLIRYPDLHAFIASIGFTLVIEDNLEAFRAPWQQPSPDSPHAIYASETSRGWWAILSDKRVIMSTTMLHKFQGTYATLQRNLVMP